MLNPIKAVTDWLQGEDLKPRTMPEPEIKLYTIDDIRAVITVPPLIHGPGATETLAGPSGLTANSAVYACLSTICEAYPEAPAKVMQRSDPTHSEWLLDSGMQTLLDQPNPFMSPDVFWWWVQWAKHAAGNAYVIKARNGNPETGNVVQLWPVHPLQMRPVTVKGSGEFISYYEREVAPAKWEPVSISNVVHFRMGISDLDMRLGMSPLQRLVSETCSDADATMFTRALLANYGVPGLVVQIPPDTNMDEAQATQLKERIGNAFGSNNRGNVGVLTAGATMSQFGFSPEAMDLRAIHRIPEERISAVLRVPAIVAGLGAGLERSTFSNVREAREMFTEQKMIPMYRADAATLNLQLRPDFTADKRVFVEFDITDLRALQEDQNAKYLRLDTAVKTGWIDADEARVEVGFEPRGGAAGATVTPPATTAGKLLQLKARTSPDDFPELFDAMIELALPSLQADMDEYLDEQRRRIKRRVIAAG